VKKIARGVKCRVPSAVDIEDLISAGYLGLVKAALKFDRSKGTTFTTYANIRIRGEIQDYLRGQSIISRRARENGMEEIKLVPFEAPLDDDERVKDTLVDPRPEPGAAFDLADSCNHIFENLRPRERRIFEMLYLDGLNIEQTGAIIGVSDSRIHQIKSRAIHRLRVNYSRKRRLTGVDE